MLAAAHNILQLFVLAVMKVVVYSDGCMQNLMLQETIFSLSFVKYIYNTNKCSYIYPAVYRMSTFKSCCLICCFLNLLCRFLSTLQCFFPVSYACLGQVSSLQRRSVGLCPGVVTHDDAGLGLQAFPL